MASELGRTQSEARQHAATCRRCFVPIIDEEGNPGLFSEACAQGAAILREYVEAEKAVMEHQPHPGPSVPEWWVIGVDNDVQRPPENDVALTPRKACEAGQEWMVKVSGRVVRVRITRVGHRPSFGSRSGRSVQRPWFWGVNTKTGREIEGNRMRLRQRVS
jgi:hypothetical protein